MRVSIPGKAPEPPIYIRPKGQVRVSKRVKFTTTKPLAPWTHIKVTGASNQICLTGITWWIWCSRGTKASLCGPGVKAIHSSKQPTRVEVNGQKALIRKKREAKLVWYNGSCKWLQTPCPQLCETRLGRLKFRQLSAVKVLGSAFSNFLLSNFWVKSKFYLPPP